MAIPSNWGVVRYADEWRKPYSVEERQAPPITLNTHNVNPEDPPPAEDVRDGGVYFSTITSKVSQDLPPLPEDRPEARVVVPGIPPLPVKRPMVSPVVALKKETARGYNYTPEATEQLYQTPVHLEMRRPSNFPTDYLGSYTQALPGRPSEILVRTIPDFEKYQGYLAGSDRMITEGFSEMADYPYMQYADPNPSYGMNDPEGILAHEFGHKWYFENLPNDVRGQWSRRFDEAQRAGEDWAMQDNNFSPIQNMLHFPARESYAEAAKLHNQPEAFSTYGYGTSGLTSQEDWNRYYPGLYR